MLKLQSIQLVKSPIGRIIQAIDMLVRVVTCAIFIMLLGVVTFLPMITIVPIIDGILQLIGWPKRYSVFEIFKRLVVSKGFLLLAGVFYTAEGAANQYETPALVLFQHGSKLDPFMIMNCFPQGFRSIGKTDLFLVPFVGWMSYVLGVLPIDRKHRNEAIKQLGRATRVTKNGAVLILR